jgi:hypothetical protein
MPIITLPQILRDKLGEDGARALVDLPNQADGQTKVDVLTVVEEKFERRLIEEISKLDIKISETKADLIRWMFVFWMGQIGALLGILFAFFRK